MLHSSNAHFAARNGLKYNMKRLERIYDRRLQSLENVTVVTLCKLRGVGRAYYVVREERRPYEQPLRLHDQFSPGLPPRLDTV